MNTPKHASDSMINSLWEIALRISKESADLLRGDPTLAARLDADPELQSVYADRLLEKAMTTRRRHQYTYEQTPVGHDIGWRCFDPNTYDGDPADGNCTCGYGLTQDAAYADLMHQLEDEKPKTTAPLLYSGRDEPNDYGREVTKGSAEEWDE